MAFIGADGREYATQAGMEAANARRASMQAQTAGTMSTQQAQAARDASMGESLRASTTINNYGAATPEDVKAQQDMNVKYGLKEGTGLYGDGGLAKQLQPIVQPTRTQVLQPNVVTPKPTAATPAVEVSARGSTKKPDGTPITSEYVSTAPQYKAESETGYDLPNAQDYMNMSPEQQKIAQMQRTAMGGQQVGQFYEPMLQEFDQRILEQSQAREAARAEAEKAALEKTAEYQRASAVQKAQALAQIENAARARADQASTSMSFQGFGRSTKAVDVQQAIAADKQAQIADLESKFTADVAQYKSKLLDNIDEQLKVYDENIKDIRSEKGKIEAQKIQMQGELIKDMIKNDPTDPVNMMNNFEKMSTIKLNYAKFDREAKQDAIANAQKTLDNAVKYGFIPDLGSDEQRKIFAENLGIPANKIDDVVSKAIIQANKDDKKYQLSADGQGGMYVFDPSAGQVVGRYDAWGGYTSAPGVSMPSGMPGSTGGYGTSLGQGDAAFNRIPSNAAYNQVFKPGTVGGQCGTYASTISTAPKVGNSWKEKQTKIDTQTPSVGSKLLIPLGVSSGKNPYGHVAVVLGFDQNTGNIQVVESNRNSDGKISIGQYNIYDLQKKYGQDWGFASGQLKPGISDKIGAAAAGAGVGAMLGGKSLSQVWNTQAVQPPVPFTSNQPSGEYEEPSTVQPTTFDDAAIYQKYLKQAMDNKIGKGPADAKAWAVQQANAEKERFYKEQGKGSVDTTLVNQLYNRYDVTSKEIRTLDQGNAITKSFNVNTKNPYDDQALIFSFMKVLDPGSVVREGEFKTAQNNAALLQSFGANWQNAINGTGMLLPEQRKKILDSMNQLYNQKMSQYGDLVNTYAESGKKMGIADPSMFLDYTPEYFEKFKNSPQTSPQYDTYAGERSQLQPGEILVQTRDGQIGSIPANEFNPNDYIKL